METKVRKCTRKPLRRQAARLNTSLPDTTVLANSVPGIKAFKRSVTAKAGMYTFVEFRRRGFRWSATKMKALPIMARTISTMDATDSKTTSPALLGGSKNLDIAPFRFLLTTVSFGNDLSVPSQFSKRGANLVHFKNCFLGLLLCISFDTIFQSLTPNLKSAPEVPSSMPNSAWLLLESFLGSREFNSSSVTVVNGQMIRLLLVLGFSLIMLFNLHYLFVKPNCSALA